jgi:hypothetical protein
MGVGMLGILTDGVDDTIDVLYMDEPKKKCVDGVGPMELRGGNDNTIVMILRELPPIPLGDGLIGSSTLDKTLGPTMIGG